MIALKHADFSAVAAFDNVHGFCVGVLRDPVQRL